MRLGWPGGSVLTTVRQGRPWGLVGLLARDGPVPQVERLRARSAVLHPAGVP